MNSARYVLFTFLSGDSFILFKLFYRISQTSSKCGHSLNIVEMKKDGGGGGWNKSHPPQWQIQGRGPEIEETAPPYLKVWIRHSDLSIERRKKRKFVFPCSRTVTFDQFRSSLGPFSFKIKIEDSGCKMLAI